MRTNRIASQMILIFYIVEVVLLKFQGEKIWLNNLMLLFPIGLLVPRIWRKFQKIDIMFCMGIIWSVLLELFTLLGGYKIHLVCAVVEGMIGTLLGYLGYYICEKVSI